MMKSNISSLTIMLVGIYSLSTTWLGYAQDQNPLPTATPATNEQRNIILRQGNSLFTFESETNILVPYLNLPSQENTTIGDIVFSPSNEQIYFVSITESDQISASPESNLVKLNIANGSSSILLTDNRLARIGGISPDGRFLAALIVDAENMQNSYYCLFRFETSDCLEIEPYIDLESLYWISSSQFVTLLLDTLEFFEISSDEITNYRTIELGNHVGLGATDLSHEREHLLISFWQLQDDTYVPQFIDVDLTSGEINNSEYSIPVEPQVALWKIQLSSDEQFLAIARAQHIDIISLESGNLVSQLDNILRFIWIPNSHDLLVITEDQSPSLILRLSRLDVITGSITPLLEVDEEIYLLTQN